MKVLKLLFIVFCTISCSKNHYLKKSIAKTDRQNVIENDSIVKYFNGKTSWGVDQFWKGNLLITKSEKSIEINQVGEWQQISKDGRQVYSVTQYDNFGNYKGEKIYGLSDTPDVQTKCKIDTINNKVVSSCESILKYHDTRTIRLRSKKLVIDKEHYKHGIWQYYSRDGALEKTEEYRMNKKIRASH